MVYICVEFGVHSNFQSKVTVGSVTCLSVHFHLIHFHLIHRIDHSPSHSHLQYLVIIILNRYSTWLPLSLFSQSRLWKLRALLNKVLIWNLYCITWSWSPMVLLLFVTLQGVQFYTYSPNFKASPKITYLK